MKCEHEGCDREAVACCPPDDGEDEPEPEYFCPEHAFDAGYCWCCGEFWGGIESFEFLHPGLCDHCHDELRANGAFDDDDSADPWDEMP